MAETETQRLARRYDEYDEVVEIVSAAEVWFNNAEMAPTVRHFERYPAVRHPDGNEATPDFTVLFTDDTGFVSEIASVALESGSFESLWRQLERYSALNEIPAGSGQLATVAAIDVLAFIPQDSAQRTCDLIDEKRQEGGPTHVSVLSYGRRRDGDYTFIRISRSNNPRPRGHGREPSLESWLADETNADTLSGLTKNFTPIKAKARFCNDPMSELYLAVVLWSQVLAEMAGGVRDLETTPEQIAQELSARFGRGKTSDVRAALNLLKAARLALEAEKNWVIPWQPIGSPHQDLKDALIRRLEAPPKGPITHSAKEQRRKERREKKSNQEAQDQLDLGSSPQRGVS